MLNFIPAWFKNDQLKYRTIFLWFLLLYAFIVFALSGSGNQKFENLHLLLDTSNGILSLLLALFLLAEQNNIRPNVRIYLAISFGFAAAAELLHAFVGVEWLGDFAWIGGYAQVLRPATWPPSTYALPLSLLASVWLMHRKTIISPRTFSLAIGMLTIALFGLSFYLPQYIDSGLLGIQRPTQIPVLFLLLVFIVACWRERRSIPLFEGLAWMGVFLFLSDLLMLYSTSPHEKFALMAHAGKLMAYSLLHVIQMRMAAAESRARSEAEALLLLEQQNMRKVLDELTYINLALDQHAIVDITDVNGSITYVSNSFGNISGYSHEELIGQNHRFLNSGIHSADFFREMYRTITSGRVWKGEICNRAKGGHLYWVKTTVVPVVDDSGKPRQYISIRSDITVRKNAVEELIRYKDHLEELVAEQTKDLKLAKESAEAASRAKSDFLANMSHEIRTPMNGVVGIIDILQESRLSSYQKRLVNTIRSSSLSLLEILGDILDFSKIEAGKLAVELIPARLQDVVEEAAQLIAPAAAEKDMELIVFIHPEIPCWIKTDPGRLRQILFNLLSNAVKFSAIDSKRQGQVILRAEIKTAPGAREALHIRVSDTGIGMKPETIAGLFHPFVQEDVTTTRRFGGTGLGLSISKLLAELLSGEISVNSSYGEGATFTLVLPLEPVAAMNKPPESELAKLNVLVITNHPAYREVVPAYLQAEGAIVKVVDGQEAALAEIRLSAAGGWDILLDLTPQSDFVAAIMMAIKKLRPDLPVVRLHSRRTIAVPENEIAIYANPLLRDELIQMLALAAKRIDIRGVVQLSERRSKPRKSLPDVKDAEEQGTLILLAEDNDINRDVICEQLTILGFASEAAADGSIALDKWRSGRYGLLLTDIHMPNMDGYALATAIRAEELNHTHIPIIAVTGNAMMGEVQRCLASGMDDYLSKPVRLRDLDAKVTRWLQKGRTNQKETTAVDVAVTDVSFDEEATGLAVWDDTTLERMVGNNPEMHRRLLDKFLSGAEQQVNEIINAANHQNFEVVIGVAHKLKSSSRTVGALQLGTICQKLENWGREGDRFSVELCAAEIEVAFNNVVTKIKNH